LVHLGGERRLARLEPRPVDTWPKPPEGWIEGIRAAKGLTLTLLTPALFAVGYRPGWLQPGSDGVLSGAPPGLPVLTLRLRAAAVGRWQPHSGWDLAAQVPRAGRKLVPAGAVYWLEVEGEPSLEDLNALWLASLCDHPQDRRDGFGLALPAPWDPAATNECNPPK
jgi:CRISPR-associated protein Cmr3